MEASTTRGTSCLMDSTTNTDHDHDLGDALFRARRAARLLRPVFDLSAPREVVLALRKATVATESAERILAEHLAQWDASGPEGAAERN